MFADAPLVNAPPSIQPKFTSFIVGYSCVSDYSICCDIDARGYEGKLALASLVNA